jgi:Predicted methyltransferases
MEQAATLSVVAIPIGNVEDITYRAVRTLLEAGYILCEDTLVAVKHKGILLMLRQHKVPELEQHLEYCLQRVDSDDQRAPLQSSCRDVPNSLVTNWCNT